MPEIAEVLLQISERMARLEQCVRDYMEHDSQDHEECTTERRTLVKEVQNLKMAVGEGKSWLRGAKAVVVVIFLLLGNLTALSLSLWSIWRR